MTRNEAANGGAVAAAPNASVTFTSGTISANTAANRGGAFYLDSGSVTLTGPTLTGNTAVNGSAVFVNTGRAAFTGGAYTANVSANGGAVGVGSVSARLTFTGNVQIQDNKLGTADSGTVSNVYLNQDSDDILSMTGLGDSASIGIYVPDALTEKRDVPGARFASYTSDANVGKLKNDRRGFNIQKDTAAQKLFWGKSIKVQVRYLASYSTLPTASSGDSVYSNNNYYPEFSSAAISQLADELYNKYSKISGDSRLKTAAYGGAFASDAEAFGDYVTNLSWNSAKQAWMLTKRDGTTEPLGNRTIVIYYAEPAYIAIENNTDMPLDITGLTVNGIRSVTAWSLPKTARFGPVCCRFRRRICSWRPTPPSIFCFPADETWPIRWGESLRRRRGKKSRSGGRGPIWSH